MRKVRLAILASGGGSNARAIIHYAKQHTECPYTVCVVITNNPEAGVRGVAEEESIANEIVDFAIADEQHVSDEMVATLQRYDVEMICLAGFMRKIPAEITRRYHDKILNIHPSLLPSYGGKGMYGKRVFMAVLEAGEQQTGVTIHRVNEEYDEGMIVCQETIGIDKGESVESLSEKTKLVEHRLYPYVLAKESLRLRDFTRS